MHLSATGPVKREAAKAASVYYKERSNPAF
jgi:hypothetical protein